MGTDMVEQAPDARETQIPEAGWLSKSRQTTGRNWLLSSHSVASVNQTQVARLDS